MPVGSPGGWLDRTGILGSVFLSYLLIAVILQALSGAYSSEFWDNDESAHYVTGLMVREYLLSGFDQAPLPFAKEYYDYYPKVAIGHWPPLFYLVQAVWTVPFPASRASLLVLQAALAASVALALWIFWRDRWHPALAWSCGASFVLLPAVQTSTAKVMAEILCVLLFLLATAQYEKYLNIPTLRRSVLFGLLASAAILTKANGGALALLPPLAVFLSGRFDLLRKAHFWLAAMVVALLCGPWYSLTASLAKQGWRSGTQSGYWKVVTNFNLAAHAEVVGPWLLSLAIVGLLLFVVGKLINGKGVDSRWAVLAALWLSVFVFHTYILPVREIRHQLMAVPAIVSFAVGVLAWLTSASRSWSFRPPAAALAAAALFFGTTFAVPPKPIYGSRYVVDVFQKTPALAEATNIFISSGASGEGAFIAEMAMRGGREKPRILRASKLLVDSDWGGFYRKPLVHSPHDVLQILEENEVDAVVVDLTHTVGGMTAEQSLLLRALYEDKSQFTQTGTDEMPAGTPFRIYRSTPPR